VTQETRELASVREQEQRLAEEVEALRSREARHKEKVLELEPGNLQAQQEVPAITDDCHSPTDRSFTNRS